MSEKGDAEDVDTFPLEETARFSQNSTEENSENLETDNGQKNGVSAHEKYFSAVNSPSNLSRSSRWTSRTGAEFSEHCQTNGLTKVDVNSSPKNNLNHVDDRQRRSSVISVQNMHLPNCVDNDTQASERKISFSTEFFPPLQNKTPISTNVYAKLNNLQGLNAPDNDVKFREMQHFDKTKASSDEQSRHAGNCSFFRDDVRSIDFVLAYEEGSAKQQRRRKIFHRNLVEEGLELEFEDKKDSESGEVYFVKIYAPWNLLKRYAEVLKLKKPIKKSSDYIETVKKPSFFRSLGIKNPFDYDQDLIPPEPSYFTAGFSLHRQDMFLIKNRETFFTQSQRSLVVYEILKRVKYSSKELGFGITRLLAKNYYLAAYPLHDGPYDKDVNVGRSQCFRRLLYLEWGRGARWYKKQPLHLVRLYFGDKMALYFTWLGFYTKMLIPASIFGIITFICGIFFVYSEFNHPSEEICNSHLSGNTTICPLCVSGCNFQQLEDSCRNSRIAFLFDNPMTVVFAIFMSFWATMFLELWKRKQNVVQWQWDMENYEEEEEPRPEYEEQVKTMKVNPITDHSEPYLSFMKKVSRAVTGYSVVFLMLILVMAALLGVIMYRISLVTVMMNVPNQFIQENARLAISVTAAFLNLIVIIIMNMIYERIAFWLTTYELPRTETEFEDSYTFKMFCFQFVNYYSSLIYIAIFKGRFFYYPGDQEARDNLFLSLRYDTCDPAGCLFELCAQLAIIMVGKQIFNNILELFIPVFTVWWKRRRMNYEDPKQVHTRWEQDYNLAKFKRLSLFGEYLEMVIQYGFITLFVAAFPLAPFFALLNNIIEIRLDAYKYISKVRRPLPHRVQDIGIWYSILRAITYVSVLTNAIVISYTSDFIPRLVYMFSYSDDFSLVGYIMNTLSAFNVSEYGEAMGPNNLPREQWPEKCYYKGYRNPPEHKEAYKHTFQFWHIFTARLAFILIFEHVIFFLTGIMAWAIPDMPVEVRNQIKMEKKQSLQNSDNGDSTSLIANQSFFQVEKEALFEHEMKAMKEERKNVQSQNDNEENEHVHDNVSRANSSVSSRFPSPKHFVINEDNVNENFFI